MLLVDESEDQECESYDVKGTQEQNLNARKYIMELRAQPMVGMYDEIALQFEQPQDDRYCICKFETLVVTLTNGLD